MMDITQKQTLLKNYDRMTKAVRMKLLDKYDAKLVWEMIADGRREYALLIPKIPYIGEKHIWQFNLHTCVIDLALYRALRKVGFTLPEAAQMIYDFFDAYLKTYPELIRWAYPWYFFSPLHQVQLRQGAAASQQRRYPDDWVFTYLEGDGATFDIGIDISECAIVKFFKANRAEEFVPYLCKLDHARGKYLRLGFFRHSTLIEGAPVCAGRWKRGSDTPGWPEELSAPSQINE